MSGGAVETFASLVERRPYVNSSVPSQSFYYSLFWRMFAEKSYCLLKSTILSMMRYAMKARSGKLGTILTLTIIMLIIRSQNDLGKNVMTIVLR